MANSRDANFEVFDHEFGWWFRIPKGYTLIPLVGDNQDESDDNSNVGAQVATRVKRKYKPAVGDVCLFMNTSSGIQYHGRLAQGDPNTFEVAIKMYDPVIYGWRPIPCGFSAPQYPTSDEYRNPAHENSAVTGSEDEDRSNCGDLSTASGSSYGAETHQAQEQVES